MKNTIQLIIIHRKQHGLNKVNNLNFSNIRNGGGIYRHLDLKKLGSSKYEALYFDDHRQVPCVKTSDFWLDRFFKTSKSVVPKTIKFCEDHIDELIPSDAQKLIDKITPLANNDELTRIAQLLPKIWGRLSIEQEQATLVETEKNAQAEANASRKFSTERHAHIASHLSELQVQKGMVTVHLPKGEIKLSQLALAEIPYFAKKLNENQGDQIVLDIPVDPQILEAAVALHHTPSSLVDMEPMVIFEVAAFMEKIDDIVFIKAMHKYLPHEAFSSEYLWSKLATGEDWVIPILMERPDFIFEDLWVRDVWHPDLSTARKQVENFICSISLNSRNIDTITALAKNSTFTELMQSNSKKHQRLHN
jgi:hypothetical protein